MITDQPKDGCVLPGNDTEAITGNTFNQPTCNDSEVSPFRRYLPVYSKSKGFIYKNPHCASCHGQYDVMIWKTSAYCPTSTAFSYELEECDFHFVYPGDYADLHHLECFTDYYSACPVDTSADNIYIPKGIGLSFYELKEACSLDTIPSFVNHYWAKNVFCYVCHYCRKPCELHATKCAHPRETGSRTGHDVLLRLLDFEVVRQLNDSPDTICGLDRDERVSWFRPSKL